MASVEDKVKLRKKVQSEYILGLYATQTGHPLNMAEYLDVSVEDTPSSVDGNGNAIFTASISKRDVNLKISTVEFPVNLQQVSIMKGLMKTAGGKKQHNLYEMFNYLSLKYPHIQKMMRFSDPVYIEPVEDYYTYSGRAGTYGVNVHHRNGLKGPVRKELFQIDKEDYDKILEMEGMPYVDKDGKLLPVAPNHPVGKKTVRFDADPRFQIRCEVEAKQIPGLLINKGLRDLEGIRPQDSKSKPLTIVLQCKCPKGYFCNTVKKIFASGNDITYWGPKVRGLTDKRLFCIAVPILDYILYSVPVESSIRKDWDDNLFHKLMTYVITEEITAFYDYPDPGHQFMMMLDQITNVNKEIDEAIESAGNIMPSPHTDKVISAACNSGHHTYGASRKTMEFMSMRLDAGNVAIACFHLYGMCPVCYFNANPAFSLLTDELF